MPDSLQIGLHESVTIVRSDAGVLELEAHYQGPGRPPPPHLHPHHDERFEVLAGELTVERDGVLERFGPGADFRVDQGTVHRMWNADAVEVVARWWSTPAMAAESWFRGLAALHRSAVAAGRAGPDPLAFAAHARAHRTTFRLALSGSPMLGSIVVAVLGTVGQLLGRRPTG